MTGVHDVRCQRVKITIKVQTTYFILDGLRNKQEELRVNIY
jgi:hypothetical protein